jgi:hypothetical protein
MDVTRIFWPIVEQIVKIPYDELMRSRFFDIICKCVETGQAFRLKMFGYELVHDDVNGLFYGTRDFLMKTNHIQELSLLNAAILKIEDIITKKETRASVSEQAIDQLFAQLVI